MEKLRINKYLSKAGYCSRREADRLLSEGRITVNGHTCEMGEQVSDQDLIYADGKRIKAEEAPVVLLFNKPRGIVCSTVSQGSDTTVTEYINYPQRIYPAGRLDKDSRGLLIMTNQGDLSDRIMRARNHHEKEYKVTVDKPLKGGDLKRMAGGVPILDTVSRPCKIRRTGTNTFNIILTQGLNRQIRRMCEYCGYQVTDLERIRIMNLKLGDLKEGSYRNITGSEYEELMSLLK